MPLPRGDEYQSAIQNPRVCFLDPELQTCQVEKTQLGLPKPYAGSFTTTYHLYNHSRQWAVRCFTRQVTDLQQRYRAIGRFIARKPEQYFVEANCLFQGIRINGIWLPIIKMKWVDGQPLNLFVESKLASPVKIRQMAEKFLEMTRRLEALGIAHGDLQHGNILVNNDELFLIDYDGMFLPELANLKSNEIGHPNYQHPLRSENYSEKSIDRFSAIVIYLGLVALSARPQLWEKFDQGENILFRKDDFVNPGGSELLIEMNQLLLPSNMVEKFAGICLLDLSAIPTLDEFLTGNFSYPKVDFSRFSQTRQRQGSTPKSIRSNNHASVSSTPSGKLDRMSQQELEILERLYGRQGRSASTFSTASRQTYRTLSGQATGSSSSRVKSSVKMSRLPPLRNRSLIRGKTQSSPWLRQGDRLLEITGKILLWFARVIINLFFYNRPRRFTLESLRRIGLFTFYTVSTIAILVFVVSIIGLLLVLFSP